MKPLPSFNRSGILGIKVMCGGTSADLRNLRSGGKPVPNATS
jgi:hypothetical protein